MQIIRFIVTIRCILGRRRMGQDASEVFLRAIKETSPSPALVHTEASIRGLYARGLTNIGSKERGPMP